MASWGKSDLLASLARDSVCMHQAGPGVHIRPHPQVAHVSHDSPDLASLPCLTPCICQLIAHH